jgi:hypothetical protein
MIRGTIACDNLVVTASMLPGMESPLETMLNLCRAMHSTLRS